MLRKPRENSRKAVSEIPYAYRRGGSIHYRRTVPDDVRAKILKDDGKPRREWTKSFKPGTPPEAVRRQCTRMAAEHDRLIAQARGKELSPEEIAEAEAFARDLLTHPAGERARTVEFWANESDDGRAPGYHAAVLSALEHGGKVQLERLSLRAVYEDDRKRHLAKATADGKKPRHETPFESAVARFIADNGNLDIREITHALVEAWIPTLAPQWSRATIRRRVGPLRAVVGRAYLRHEIERKNPFERHGLGGGGSADDRLPFNRVMLDKIDSYLTTSKRVTRTTRNLITLMKFTGTGPAEIGGLAIADVNLDAVVPHIWVRENAIRGLKVKDTDDGESPRKRQIPLIGEALEAAQNAVQRATVGTKGKKRRENLFPGFSDTSGANSISARVNKCLRSAGIPESPKLTGYSFRHTLKEAMRAADIPEHRQDRLMGHTPKGVAGRYGANKEKLSVLAAAIRAAVPHLGDVNDDDDIYKGFREKPKK